jgi:hypothetical protein
MPRAGHVNTRPPFFLPPPAPQLLFCVLFQRSVAAPVDYHAVRVDVQDGFKSG